MGFYHFSFIALRRVSQNFKEFFDTAEYVQWSFSLILEIINLSVSPMQQSPQLHIT